MKNSTMKKKIYKKPSMKVMLLKYDTQLLADSDPTPPDEAPDYDDWLGARRQNFDDWEEEDDRQE